MANLFGHLNSQRGRCGKAGVCQPGQLTYESLLFEVRKDLSIFVPVRARIVSGDAILQCRPGDTFYYRTSADGLVSTCFTFYDSLLHHSLGIRGVHIA
jgi:hypothetical protein